MRLIAIRHVTDASYQNLERQRSVRALTVLTQDLDIIAGFFLNLPVLAMNSSIVIGCLGYLGYLSWQVLIFAVLTILIGSLGFHFARVLAR